MVPITKSARTEAEQFSLFTGGPIYQLFLRAGLIKSPLHHLGRRILVISMLAWAPLAVLSVLGGRFLSGANVPFVHDYAVHIRLLVSLPLLVAAEVGAHNRMKVILKQFRDRQIITAALQLRFESYLGSAMSWSNASAVELGLVSLALVAPWLGWRVAMPIEPATWYATAISGGQSSTSAGSWYQFVSVPIYQLITLRWYWRIFLWARLLWQTAKLELNLVPTHPDKTCGLGFVSTIVVAMAPVLAAHVCLFSGYAANRILHEGAKLSDFYIEIGMLTLFLCLLVLGPLCAFTPSLLQTKREGIVKYGRLSSAYVVGFDRKWIAGERAQDEPLLGSSDVQSLADLATSFGIVQSITPFPFGKSSLIELAVIIAVPLLPLSLTMFSAKELGSRLLKILL